eukprot:CAMPEP_0174700660 /NCGR_PEP_ID=MMETSP1094-20130205/5550_1 /TAXON_ID=156173 /ORGANISM="Chrysochromulina brevifilum, Strain UTEX LB 985" /LENGTH=146 /DNA_ID=CAMNT_0015898179 /DNA_START=459 /DNA_END=899 /DNA_ORIENTATION=+
MKLGSGGCHAGGVGVPAMSDSPAAAAVALTFARRASRSLKGTERPWTGSFAASFVALMPATILACAAFKVSSPIFSCFISRHSTSSEISLLKSWRALISSGQLFTASFSAPYAWVGRPNARKPWQQPQYSAVMNSSLGFAAPVFVN